MKVTVREIRQQGFALRFRGYDSTEVDRFLELVAGQIEDLLKETAELREALVQQEHDIQCLRQAESDWKKSLLTAQQINEDLIGRTQQRAQAILLEAQGQAHQVLEAAERGRRAIAHDVQLLQCQKRQLMDGLHTLLSQHLGLLHVQQGQDDRRQGSDVPGPMVAALTAPQTMDDVALTAERRSA